MKQALRRGLLVLLLLGSVGPVAAQRTDEVAVHAAYLVNFLRYARWLGIGIATVVNALEPERSVIGGGISEGGELFLEGAARKVFRLAA